MIEIKKYNIIEGKDSIRIVAEPLELRDYLRWLFNIPKYGTVYRYRHAVHLLNRYNGGYVEFMV